MSSTVHKLILQSPFTVEAADNTRLLEVTTPVMHAVLLERKGQVRALLQDPESSDNLADILRDIDETFNSADPWESLTTQQQVWLLKAAHTAET